MQRIGNVFNGPCRELFLHGHYWVLFEAWRWAVQYLKVFPQHYALTAIDVGPEGSGMEVGPKTVAYMVKQVEDLCGRLGIDCTGAWVGRADPLTQEELLAVNRNVAFAFRDFGLVVGT